MSYRTILLVIGVTTLLLNLILTMYMLRIHRRLKPNSNNHLKRIVTFQLPRTDNHDVLSTVMLEEKDETSIL